VHPSPVPAAPPIPISPQTPSSQSASTCAASGEEYYAYTIPHNAHQKDVFLCFSSVKTVIFYNCRLPKVQGASGQLRALSRSKRCTDISEMKASSVTTSRIGPRTRTTSVPTEKVWRTVLQPQLLTSHNQRTRYPLPSPSLPHLARPLPSLRSERLPRLHE
jgi:hypothetical protein